MEILRKSFSKGNSGSIQRIEREQGDNQAKKETKENERIGGGVNGASLRHTHFFHLRLT